VNILVISSNLIGDNILSTGIIRDFINQNTNSKLTIVVGPTAAQIYKNFPNIEKVIIIKKEKYKLHWFNIWKRCVFKKWDIIIDFRSSAISHLLLKNKSYIFKHAKKNITHQVDQFIKFFNIKNKSEPIIYNNDIETNIAKKNINPENRYITISPGGNWLPKIWPIERYNEFIIELLNKHKNLLIILVGSDEDKEKYKQKLIQNIDDNRIIDLMGETITQTYAYMKLSNLFVGNDSGLMHLAAAAKISTIGLFGPTNHILYAPYGSKSFIIRTKESFEEFKSVSLDKYKTYMHTIAVNDVIKKIEKEKLL
tara:strand:+ start:1090 stop:2019 length:930 start_codon:yes stop_codon:yes gene_type:complete